LSRRPAPPAASSRAPRIAAIDILRGVAIAWVLLFHLWGDLEFFPGVPKVYYDQLAYQVREGTGAWRIFTSCTDLLFRDGFQGVPLFMMISGVSLTVATYRASGRIAPGAMLQRFRRLLVPYWAGVGLTYGVMALIALRQAHIGEGSFSAHFTHGVTISRLSLVNVDGGVAFASLTLVPRLLHDEWFFAPQLALWFVGLLLQYYLLFPLLFFAMRRIGVVAFVVLTFALTVGANVWVVERYGAPEFQFRLVTGWAPFRLFEFTSGMAIGWLIAAPEAERALAWARRWPLVLLALGAGFAAHTAGDLLIGRWTAHEWQALALPLVTLGLALLALPLLARRPARVELTAPLRAVAYFGTMSYAILIVNDAMRLVASQVRVETPPDPVWWAFLVGIYMPASVLLAWPIARVLGLLPQARRPARRPEPEAEPRFAQEPPEEPLPAPASG